MALLEVKDLTKTFQKQGNRITAVDHVTLEMAEGECLGLIGFFKNNTMVAYPVGLIFAACCFFLFRKAAKKYE